MPRPTLTQARARYVHRFTAEHIPAHCRKPHVCEKTGKRAFYAPQFASDAEWYANTKFPGEPGLHGNSRHCETTGQTWPLGKGFLAGPFHLNPNQTAKPFAEIAK